MSQEWTEGGIQDLWQGSNNIILRTKYFLYTEKEGNGFLTTSTLKEILKELDPKLSEVEEIIPEFL